jgi:hypothetical protein
LSLYLTALLRCDHVGDATKIILEKGCDKVEQFVFPVAYAAYRRRAFDEVSPFPSIQTYISIFSNPLSLCTFSLFTINIFPLILR